MENTESNQNSEDQVVENTAGDTNPLGDPRSDSQETVTTPEEAEVKAESSDENVETDNQDTKEIPAPESNPTTSERSPGKTDRGL
ncbi:hypothetical protein [Moorena sp. SIO3B2]|uniref:hypothetical protein n=1 Tax=Moorena sp. SIO3B2 TaxID=2607827 RepID=UPI0013C19AAA|nr:hypothetical protein [Moorena sp. SIO3B2]NEP34830.1 hypothetical protein [Moorena sp. SIO3B2]NEQ12959.1 hypothetical protein [Moorena sp. SIO3E2]